MVIFVMFRTVGALLLKPDTFIWLFTHKVLPAAIDVPLKFELMMLTASARTTLVRATKSVADAIPRNNFFNILLIKTDDDAIHRWHSSRFEKLTGDLSLTCAYEVNS